jgi:hypothetical protein
MAMVTMNMASAGGFSGANFQLRTWCCPHKFSQLSTLNVFLQCLNQHENLPFWRQSEWHHQSIDKKTVPLSLLITNKSPITNDHNFTLAAGFGGSL